MSVVSYFSVERGHTVARAEDNLINRLTSMPAFKGIVVSFQGEPTDVICTRIASGFLSRGAPPPTETGRWKTPLLPVAAADRRSFTIATVVHYANLTVVSAEEVTRLAVGWPSSSAAMSEESLFSIVRRCGARVELENRWFDLEQALRMEFDDLNLQWIGSVTESLASTVRATFTDSPDVRGQRQRALGEMLDWRSAIQEATLHVRAHGMADLPISSQLAVSVTSVDSLINGLVGAATLALHEAALGIAAAQQDQQSVDERSDRLVARFAAALLLPGLWFSLLGANVLPPQILGLRTASMPVFIVTAVVAVGLALVGWFIVPQALKVGQRRNKKVPR